MSYDGLPRISSPSSRIDPRARGGVMPMIALHRVDFPMPLRPTMPVVRWPIEAESPFSTCALP